MFARKKPTAGSLELRQEVIVSLAAAKDISTGAGVQDLHR